MIWNFNRKLETVKRGTKLKNQELKNLIIKIKNLVDR